MNSAVESFRLAPMSGVIRTLTVALCVLPVALMASAAFYRGLAVPALLMLAIYAWVWLRFRPTRFDVHPWGLEVVWPFKRRTLRRDEISVVRLVGTRELRSEIGWCLRIGAGGLWGAFGWLWTSRRGIIQMYVSRTDGFVWIERAHGKSWLITPERPEAFVRALER